MLSYVLSLILVCLSSVPDYEAALSVTETNTAQFQHLTAEPS